jgi:hypothetical protein
MCIGCLSPFNIRDLAVTVGKADPDVGKKLLGFAFFGVASYFLARSDADAVAELIPVCDQCLSKITDAEREDLSKKLGMFSGHKRACRFFSCEITRGCVNFVVKHHVFASAVQALNPGLAFTSLSECLNAEIPTGHPLAGSLNEDEQVLNFTSGVNPALPEIPAGKKSHYESQFGWELSPYDLAIINSWHKELEGKESIFTYPEIPAKKIQNAKAQYAFLREDEFVIGLQDSTAFGSAKAGFLVTNKSIYWRSTGSGQQGQILFSEIDPHSVDSEYTTFSTRRIVLGKDKRIDLSSIEKYETLLSIASFITNASMIMRCRLAK